MHSSSHVAVAIVGFALGCGVVGVLRSGDEGVSELIQQNELIQAELARTTGELETARAENRGLRSRLEADESGLPREQVTLPTEPRIPATTAEPVDPATDPLVASLRAAVLESLRAGDPDAAARLLADAFTSGELTRLELMNLAVGHPELIRAGINDHAQADAFRDALIEALSSTDDPIGILAGVNIRGEPNQAFASRMAAHVRSIVDGSEAADGRAFGVIQALLAGNPMRGEKINLYPALAQLGSRGDDEARAFVEQWIRDSQSMFADGVRTLLDPPRSDEVGGDLRGVVIFSSQFNKGDWSHRPKTLELGDIILSIGEVTIGNRGDFQKAVSRYPGGDGQSFVPVKVYARLPDGSYQVEIRQMDPGDFRLMYGVYTVGS